jgi:hypothetical protein
MPSTDANSRNINEMSYPTQQVFIHKGSWDDESRLHPVMKWMETYTYEFDRTQVFTKGGSPNDWLTSDFSVTLSDGTRITGMESALQALKEKYAPFSGGQKHDSTELLMWEDGEQWVMFGSAKVYVGFDGVDVAKEIRDLQGEAWHAAIRATYRFVYVREESKHGGFKMKEAVIYADPMPAIEFMLKQGIVSAKDLGLA